MSRPSQYSKKNIKELNDRASREGRPLPAYVNGKVVDSDHSGCLFITARRFPAIATLYCDNQTESTFTWSQWESLWKIPIFQNGGRLPSVSPPESRMRSNSNFQEHVSLKSSFTVVLVLCMHPLFCTRAAEPPFKSSSQWQAGYLKLPTFTSHHCSTQGPGRTSGFPNSHGTQMSIVTPFCVVFCILQSWT